jgi:hypothetical protein
VPDFILKLTYCFYGKEVRKASIRLFFRSDIMLNCSFPTQVTVPAWVKNIQAGRQTNADAQFLPAETGSLGARGLD